MKLTNTLDPKVGGKVRVVLAWAAVIVQALQGVDWEQSIPFIVVALISSFAHLTSKGNVDEGGA